jgi:hypothetical protein
VPRFRTLLLICSIACFSAMLCGMDETTKPAARPSEALLPSTTQGFFAISNVDLLSERWNKTQLGHLMADPVMEPFTKDIRRQFEERWSSVHDRLGLTLEDMKGVPGGDVGIGLISPKPGRAALAIVVDVSGKTDNAKEMLKQVTARQLQRGAKRSEFHLKGCPDPVIQFDLPDVEENKPAEQKTLEEAEEHAISAPADDPQAAESEAKPDAKPSAAEEANQPPAEEKSRVKEDAPAEEAAAAPPPAVAEKPAAEQDKTKAGKKTKPAAKQAEDAEAEDETPRPRQAFYCLTGNLLAVADDRDVMQGILDRFFGKTGDSLADQKPFQAVMRRCAEDYGNGAPQMRWFIHPLGYAEASRAATPPERRRKGKSILEIMRNQGVGAVLGIGGLADFSAENYELVHRTAIHAPGPYENAMKMAVLPNAQDFTPQDWAPRDVATYTTFYFDVLNAFDNFGPLFDELVGQGEKGVWEETIQSLKLDLDGPQIDLRKDLIEHLGRRVTLLTDYQLPITTSSERLLLAVESKNDKAVAAAIEKLFKNDPTVTRRDVKGHVIWEMVGDQTAEMKPPEMDFGDMPSVSPAHLPKKKKKHADEEEEEERKPLMPHRSITVCKGQLFISSHIDFLLKVIAPEGKPDLLKDDVDFQLVEAELGTFKPTEKCFRFFSRTDEEFRPTYEMIRQNKLPESESMLARSLNVLFGEGKKGARRQKIDGSQLPDYQIVRRYLGPAGLQVVSEPDGWFLKGMLLSKEAE